VDNFDRSHPVYRTIATLARLRQAHPALADGVQQPRYSSASAGILAYSRTLARERIEYVVVLNNATTSKTAKIPTYSPGMRFTRIWSTGQTRAQLTTGADRAATVTMPGLSAAVYRAVRPLTGPVAAPSTTLKVAATVNGRPEVRADVAGDALYQVTFYARTGGGSWTLLGTDDHAPYRVFPDLSGYRAGTRVDLMAVTKDTAGHSSSARTSTTVVAPQGTGAGVATVHYHRTDGNYAGWGIHVWGDALADGVATTWDAPRAPARTDAFGAVFEIPLADTAPALNFILHKAGGDSVPTTREPGGDRAFVPAVDREVWISSGDPTIHPDRP
jgi:hypothetical protein